jgi:hypothetical protein
MRMWGVDNWPDVDADYFVWNGCGVFALIDNGEFTDLHLAMRKGSRRKCREFVESILNHCKKPIRAMIEIQYRQVCNLAKNMGFYHVANHTGKRLDGTLTEVIEMRRYL